MNPLDERLRAIEKGFEGIARGLDELESRLAPVRNITPRPVKDGGEQATPIRSSLAVKLVEHNEITVALSMRIRELIDSIDL